MQARPETLAAALVVLALQVLAVPRSAISAPAVLALTQPSPVTQTSLDALRAAYRAGRELALAGRHAAAAEAFGQAAAHPTLSAYAQYEQASALLRSGNAGAASAAAGILRRAERSAPARLRGAMLIALADAEMALGRSAQAVIALQKAAALRPDDPEVWLRLRAADAGRGDLVRTADIDARVRLLHAKRLASDGEWSRAATEFHAVVAAASSERSVAGEAWYRLGEIHIATDSRRAHNAFVRAARLGWNTPGAWYWAAAAARRAGLATQASHAAAALLKVQPHGTWAARHWLGTGLRAESNGRMGEAAVCYRRAIAAAPSTGEAAEARWRLGWIALSAGRYTDAEARFKEAAHAAPYRTEAARAWYWAAKTLEARSRHGGTSGTLTGEAEALLRRVARDYPLTFYGQRARARLGMPAPSLQPAPPGAPDALPGSRAAPAHEELAHLGLYADAALAAEDALDAGPRDLRIVRFLAETLARLGAVHRSVVYAEEALAGGMRDAAVWRLAYPRAYWPEVTRAAQEAGVDPLLLIALVREESRYDPAAMSPARAVGLAQILPTTAQAMTGDSSITASRLKDPATNLSLGARYLRLQMDRFGGDLRLALAAYNAGPAAARRWKDLDTDPDYLIEKIGYAETRAYVRRVLGSYGIYRLLQ